MTTRPIFRFLLVLGLVIMTAGLLSCDFLLAQLVPPSLYVPQISVQWQVSGGVLSVLHRYESFSIDVDLAGNFLMLTYEDYSWGSVPEFPSAVRTSRYSTLFDLLSFFLDQGVDLSNGFNGSITPYWEYDTITVDYSSTAVSVVDLPVPAARGILDTGLTDRIEGTLVRVDMIIPASVSWGAGSATLVFSSDAPGGLLYIGITHDNGYRVVLYATYGEGSGGSFFPDGSYTYLWSIFREN